MSWYAVDAIDDSLNATKAFLFPFSLGRWAKLALVTLFLGAGGGGVQQILQVANSASKYAGSGTGPGPSSGGSYALAPLVGEGPSVFTVLTQVGEPIRGGLPFALGLVGILLIGLILLLLLLLILAQPVFTFVFVDAIESGTVRIRKPFKRHFWKGVRLLVFQVGVVVLFVGLTSVVVALFTFGGVLPDLGVLGILGAILLVALWLLLLAVVLGFTKQFVVPVMYVDDTGIIAAWSEVWSLLADEPKQSLVYLLVHLLVGIGVSIIRGLLSLLGVFLVGIVALVLGFVASTVVGGAISANVGIGVGVLVGVAVGVPLYFVLVFLPLNVLTQTYLRTYELASLAGFASRYDTLNRYRDDGGDSVGGTTDEDVPPGGSGGIGSVSDAGLDDKGGPDDAFGEFVPAEDLKEGDELGNPDTRTDVRSSGTAVDLLSAR